MIDFIKQVLLRIYMYYIGVNFYIFEHNDIMIVNDTLTVQYENDAEIKFFFHKTSITSFSYILNNIYYKHHLVYSVSASFSDNMPIKLLKYKNKYIGISGWILNNIKNEQLIYQQLVNVYLDHITKDMVFTH